MMNWDQCVAVLLLTISSQVVAGPADRPILGTPFGDHMVLQRDRPIPIWGDASSGGSQVRVELGPLRGDTFVDADGHWEVRLGPLPAGGPHVLRASIGDQAVEIRDVLVGDVWLCSGQSNMQMTLKECDGGSALADQAGGFSRLRLATVGRKGISDQPQRRGEMRWSESTPTSARDFSAIGYYVASGLLADPATAGVPLGFINCSSGGSQCEGWVPAEALGGIDRAGLKDSMFAGGPSCLYNTMVAPLGQMPLRGVVWYQGEANADRPGLYPTVLGRLVNSWRQRFESPDLPFVIVGLPDWAAGADGTSWAWIREAQEKVSRILPHVAVAQGTGTTDGFDLHPKQKAELGHRASLVALRLGYARDVRSSGPTLDVVHPEGDSLRLGFTLTGESLTTRGGGPVRGFAVAGPDGRYVYADAKIQGNSVLVRSREVAEPRTVRYGWAGVPDANLTDRSGLPAPSFRTDTAEPPDVDVQPRPLSRLVRMKRYEVTVDGSGSVCSLGVAGQQFLSNAIRGGGTSVPGWFGPRDLGRIVEPGPGRVTCSDDAAQLELEFATVGMDWTITNKSRDAIKFRIALASRVDVIGSVGAGPLTLRRGSATLAVTGIEALNRSDDGPVLEVNVPPHASRRLTIRVDAP